jgi:lauroyl/myristoyl acyltransferase
MLLMAKDLGGLGLYYPGQALLSRLPRPLLRQAARLGGDVVRALSADMDEALAELESLFGDRPLPQPAREIVRDAWRINMFNELEVLRYPHYAPKDMDAVCEVVGLEHLDAALERGKGALILIGHLGANQMIMPALGHKGYAMNQLSAPPPVWAEILIETRTTPLWRKVLARRWELEQRLPVQHINVFKFLRPAYDCLFRNEVLGLAFDGGGGRRWTQVDFMARRANLSTQPLQLAAKTGAAILPTRVCRQAGTHRHQVVIHPPLQLESHPDRAVGFQINMQTFTDIFAEWVEENPAEYLYFLLLRRRVRGSDVRPFFEDYPPLPGQMNEEDAREHLRRAGASH